MERQSSSHGKYRNQKRQWRGDGNQNQGSTRTFSGGNQNPGLSVNIGIEGFKPYSSGTLQGYVDIRLVDLGLVIAGFGIHSKGDSRWITFPQTSYVDSAGAKHFVHIMGIGEKPKYWAFTNGILSAFDEWQRRNGSANA